MKFAPWRPVKLLAKVAVCAATLMAAAWRYTHDPYEP